MFILKERTAISELKSIKAVGLLLSPEIVKLTPIARPARRGFHYLAWDVADAGP